MMNDKLGELMMALFPGIRLTSAQLQQDIHTSKMTLEFTGSWQVLVDPESMLDPAIRRILRAERSAGELRTDKDDE